MRLIDADNLPAHKVRGEIGNLSGDFVPGFCIDREPTVDAVLRDEYDALLRRFQHLLQSDYIRSFDEYDCRTGTYKRDIFDAVAPAVEMVRCKDCVHYDNTPYDWIGPRYCECLGCYRQGDFYCAYGKKRPGND